MKYVKTVQNHDEIKVCKYCGSRKLKKAGIRKNKSGNVQIIACLTCGKRFSANTGFRYRRYPKETITDCLQMYFSGMSERKISEFFEAKGLKIDHSAIHRWIERYVRVSAKYMDSIKPHVGNTFRADEVWVNVEGKKKYLFASMDDETRFWLASDLADTKHQTVRTDCLSRPENRPTRYPIP